MNESPERRTREPEPSLADIVDGAVRRIATAISIAGLAVALAIYARPGPPRYQAFATERGIVRVDTREGMVIACEAAAAGCYVVRRRGQDFIPNPNRNRPAAPAPQQGALPDPNAKALRSPSAASPPTKQ